MAALLIAFRQKTLLLQDEFKIVSVKKHPWEIRGAVSPVGTASLDFLFVNLSDVLFKFVHALIL